MFYYKNWPGLRYFIDDYIKYGRMMGLYNYITRYLFLLEISFDEERKEYVELYNDFLEMQNRFKNLKKSGYLFLELLNTNLDFHYNRYMLRTEVPTMEINKSFEDFCNKWELIYLNSITKKLVRVITPKQNNFLEKLYDPRTKIGRQFMIKHMEPLFD